MSFFRLPVCLLACLLCWGASPAVAQLQVDKIEPPNWWTGMRWNQVQLMLYGQNLAGLTAEFVDPRLHIAAVHTLPHNPAYAFVDVHIPADLPAGNYTLRLRQGANQLDLTYPIANREPSANRHQGFGPDDVVYLITPDRFANGNPANDRANGLDDYDPSQPGKRHGGDIEGIIRQLDYLRDLGVTALWMNPLLENNGQHSYHGYAATDLYRIDPRFGSNADFQRLTTEAHRRGLKIIWDHVANHIGINHPWMNNLPDPSWLNGSVDNHLLGKHYLGAITDPHAAPGSVDLLKDFWFVDDMPDLNQRNPYLANYLIQNTLWWMEYTGLDGVREDTYPYPDQAFMARWARAILDEYPRSNIVGEIWYSAPAYIAQFQTHSKLPRNFDTHLPAVMDFPLCNALRAYVKGTGLLREVYDVFVQDFLYTDLDNLLVFVDNHDMTRAIYEARGHTQRVHQALTLALTTRGIPQLLYGTEIGMVGGESHPELRADFPGGFPGHARSAFTPTGRTPEENQTFDFQRRLLQLRARHPALRRGQLLHYPPTWDNEVYRYWKILGDEKILVIINGYDEAKHVSLDEMASWLPARLQFRDLLTDTDLQVDLHAGLELPARGIRMLQWVE